uniref:Uncharacterized protein n=1 Tax=Glossina pallidipes TaxID=7398 RepID=A0A1A9ZTY8_GLOPL
MLCGWMLTFAKHVLPFVEKKSKDTIAVKSSWSRLPEAKQTIRSRFAQTIIRISIRAYTQLNYIENVKETQIHVPQMNEKHEFFEGTKAIYLCPPLHGKLEYQLKYLHLRYFDYVKMRDDNRTHIRRVYHAENTLRTDGKQRSHSAISTNFSVSEQSAKVDAGKGSPVSNLATLAYKISQEKVDLRISMNSLGRGRKLDHSNAGRKLQFGPFIDCRLEKLEKLLNSNSDNNSKSVNNSNSSNNSNSNSNNSNWDSNSDNNSNNNKSNLKEYLKYIDANNKTKNLSVSISIQTQSFNNRSPAIL